MNTRLFVSTYDQLASLSVPFLFRIKRLLNTSDQSLLLERDAQLWVIFEVQTQVPERLEYFTYESFYQADPKAIAMCLTREDAGVVEIWNVVVDPDAQGKGLARFLLQSVQAAKPGKTFWLGVLFTNPMFEVAVRVYAKVGFGRPRMSTCPPLTRMANPVPFLEMTTGMPPSDVLSEALVLRSVFRSVREEKVRIPWKTLSALVEISNNEPNEVSGALTQNGLDLYDNPLRVEPKARWGSLDLRYPFSPTESLFVGRTETAPSLTTFKNTILFHTHPRTTYESYKVQSELSTDFPSGSDLVIALTTLTPNMMISQFGVFLYQVTPVLSMVILNSDENLRTEIINAVSMFINQLQTDLRWTRDTKYMELESLNRTQLIQNYYNDLTIYSILEYLSEPERTALLSKLNVTEDQKIFVNDIMYTPVPSDGYVNVSIYFPK